MIRIRGFGPLQEPVKRAVAVDRHRGRFRPGIIGAEIVQIFSITGHARINRDNAIERLFLFARAAKTKVNCQNDSFQNNFYLIKTA
jgi:hypothetical protein